MDKCVNSRGSMARWAVLAGWVLMGGWLPTMASAQRAATGTASTLDLSPPWWLWFLLVVFVSVHWAAMAWLIKQLRSRIRDSVRMDPLLERTRFQLHREIARHETTEELLLETRDYLHCLINSMPSVIIGVTEAGEVTHWNQAAIDLTGIASEQALGHKVTELIKDPEIRIEQISHTIANNTPYVDEALQTGQGVDARYTDLTIHPLVSPETVGAVIVIQDVTLRVRMERSMIQNEKMLSLGEMAAGLAHEINNPLSAIMSNVQTINRRFSVALPANTDVADELGLEFKQLLDYLEKRQIPELIEGIHEAGERAARIVKTMLEFSHAHNPEFSEQNPVDLINQSLDLAANTLRIKGKKNPIKMPFVIRDFESDLPKIECSASEIQQVLLNLLLNAAQAIQSASEENPNPTITLRLARIKERLLIEVQDNGPGMPERVQKHIFEPFFTTKEVGSGTGLGLSVSYFIIHEHHQGSIHVQSHAGEGTKFVIELPLRQPVPQIKPHQRPRSYAK